jgi:hypothetical protein
MFVNTPTSSTPTYAWSPGTYDYYPVFGNAGDDTLIVMLSNGNPLPSVALTFDGGAGADRVVVVPIGFSDGSATLVSGGVIPGGATGPRINYSAVESISSVFDSSAAPAAPVSGLSVYSAAGLVLRISAPQHLDSLKLDGNAVVTPGGDNTVYTRSLDMLGGTQLDLGDNDLIVDYGGASPLGSWTGSSYSGLSGLVASGRDGGWWDGLGINSAAARADPNTSLAVAEASAVLQLNQGQTALFSGEAVDSTCVLIKYTYTGDVNLDGRDNIDDYGPIDSNQSLLGGNYGGGDINFDGRVNIDDLSLLDAVIGVQGPIL